MVIDRTILRVCKVVYKDGCANGAEALTGQPHRLRDSLYNSGQRANLGTGGAACKPGALPAELPPRKRDEHAS